MSRWTCSKCEKTFQPGTFQGCNQPACPMMRLLAHQQRQARQRPAPSQQQSQARARPQSRPTAQQSGPPRAAAQGARPGRPDPLLGKVIGGCELLAVVGRGAMGSVYRARQVSLDRPVAVKTIRPEFCDDPSFLKRFQHEARTVGRFHTPYVVQIHEVGVQQGVHFIVMEYARGGDLLTYARRRPEQRMHTAEVLRFLREVCEGLLEAERLRVVHRDIKPENLLLDHNAHIKIADFGVAKVFGANANMTMNTAVLGTPVYMSPEQASGGAIDHRTDMYAVGASFFHLMTGQAPLTGSSVYEIIRKKIEVESLRPRDVINDPSVPEALSRIIERMTAREPDDRYSSFADVIRDIDNIRAGRAVGTRRRAGGGRLGGVAMLLLATLLGFGGWLGYEWYRTRPISTAVAYALGAARHEVEVTDVASSPTGSDGAEVDVQRRQPADLDALRQRLAELRGENATSGFEAAAGARALAHELETLRASQDPIASHENFDALRRESGQLAEQRLAQASAWARAELEKLREQFVETPPAQLQSAASQLEASIPANWPQVSELRGEVVSFEAAVRKARSMYEELERLAGRQSVAVAPPYSDLATHWSEVQQVLETDRDHDPALRTWVVESRERLATRLLAAIEESFREEVEELRKAMTAFESGDVAPSELDARLERIEEEKESLANSSVGEAARWESIAPTPLLDKVRGAIRSRRAAQEPSVELLEAADRVERRLERADSLVVAARVLNETSSQRREIAAYLDAHRSGRTQVSAQLADRLEERWQRIERAADTWRGQLDLCRQILDDLAERRLLDREARQRVETLKGREVAASDFTVQGLVEAWESLESGFRGLSELDVDRARRSFEEAGKLLDLFAATASVASLDEAFGSARAYVAQCGERCRDLERAVATMAPVPSGPVRLPSPGRHRGERRVDVQGFFIDRHEVTVREFREFLAHLEGQSYDDVSHLFDDVATFDRSRRAPPYLSERRVEDDWPIEEVSYHQALAYVKWQRKDLFTFGEWFLAAKGALRDGEHRELPSSRSQLHVAAQTPVSVDERGRVLGFSSRHAVRHLAGNVAEWCRAPARARRAPVVGGRYLDRDLRYCRGDRVRALPQSTVMAGFGFRGVIRVRDFFGDLAPR